jgi:hypothetical protein
MHAPLDTIELAIDSVVRLKKLLSQRQSKQVTAKDELLSIKAVTHTWFNTLRPTLNHPSSIVLLTPLNTAYNALLEFSDRFTNRSKYKTHLKDLKAELMRFRSQITVLISSGQITSHQKLDFSKLVTDKALLVIVDRRWDETRQCIEDAPLAAIVMIGALLEALFLSRIQRAPSMAPLFKLKCTPKDKTGKPKELTTWTLNDYMNACFEMGWIRKPIKDIGAVLRDYRNLIHPREELRQKVSVNVDDAKMYWAVFTTMAEQIVKSI